MIKPITISMLSPHNFLYIFYLFTPLLYIQIKWGFLCLNNRNRSRRNIPKKTYSFIISKCKLLGIPWLHPLQDWKKDSLIYPLYLKRIPWTSPSSNSIRIRGVSLEKPILIWRVKKPHPSRLREEWRSVCCFRSVCSPRRLRERTLKTSPLYFSLY